MCWSRTLLLAFICAAGPAHCQHRNEPGIVACVDVLGLVRHRYATVRLNTLLENPHDTPVQANISLHVPENAFVSYAILEVDGEVTRGQVQERKVAHEQYQLAASTGATASQVSAVRDANEIKILVNVEAKSRAIFNLTYEELLVRRKGRYELVINADPEQELEKLNIEVEIQESKNITFVSVPPFSTTVRPDDLDNSVVNPDVKIEFNENEDHAKVKYLKEKQKDGPGVLSPGPLVVRYDVDRGDQAGEILLMDGFFVHFLSTDREKSSISALPKHAIFVLDSSASMWGSKLEQLKIAMSQILRQLRKQDVFSIVTFGNRASEWSLPGLTPAAGKGVYAVNRRNVAQAMEFIGRMQANGGTNIQHALRRALYLSARFRNITLISGVSEGDNYTTPKPPPERDIKPVVMFLTDGVPTAGEVRLTKLLKSIEFANRNTQASIFALALGPSANYGFLRRMALQNSGFSRRIYESSDTALQLQSFYQEISSPMLTNVTFAYVDHKVNASSVTKRKFPTMFSGSEAVVAGKLTDFFEEDGDTEFGVVTAKGAAGNKFVENVTIPEISGSAKNTSGVEITRRRRIGILEKMWAHLTIRQLLDNYMIEDTADDDDSEEVKETIRASTSRDRALALALKYGFVTPLTSLVMVSKSKKVTIIETNEVEKDIVQSEVEVNDKFVSAASLPLSIQQSVLNRPASTTPDPEESTKNPFDTYDWLATLLAENDSITFIKPDGDEVTRIVSSDFEVDEANLYNCTYYAKDRSEYNGLCMHLLACPSEQALTFDDYLRRYCDFDGVHLGVCCASVA